MYFSKSACARLRCLLSHLKLDSSHSPMNTTDITRTLQTISQNLYGWVSLPIFVIGTFGNLSNMILFLRLESLNTLASSLFLFASFIGSECVMLTATLFRILYGLTGFDPLFSSIVLCKFRWMIGPASGAFALTCVGLAASDRYLLIRSQYRSNMALKKACFCILTVALFWLAFFSMYAVYFIAPTANSCQLVNPTVIQLMPFVSLFVYSIIPIAGLSWICYLIWKALGQLPATFLRGGNRLYDQVTRMVISQIIVIVLTSSPSAAYSIYTISTRAVKKDSLRSAVENLVSTICVLIGFLTHAIMFYVYLIASPHFRQNVTQLLRVILQRSRRCTRFLHPNTPAVFPATE